MRRNSHHRTVAVVGQDVVRRPDRQSLAIDGVDRETVEEDAGLRSIGGLTVDLARLLDRLQVLTETLLHLLGRPRRQLGGKVGVGRDDHESRTVQRVRSGREDPDLLVTALDLEVDVGADRPADPVALHLDDLLRPEALELIQIVEQAVGVLGDLEVPLRELLLDHLGAAALAMPVDDLLVGEHRLVVRAPVDRTLLAVSQPLLVQLLEQPLVPGVVLGVARMEHAAPVERDAVLVQALLLLGDVVVRPCAGVGTALDGGVLSGQAEAVPADRVQHVVTAVPPEAGHDVGVEVVLGVPHVKVARGVREHREDVLAGTLVVIAAGPEGIGVCPGALPLRLHGVGVVSGGIGRVGAISGAVGHG